MQLDRLTNQARFIQMIIKKEIVVSGRKKAEIVKDLKAKGFRQFPKVTKAVAAGETEETVEDDEEAEVDTSDSNGGYEYLLTVVSTYFLVDC
jgi:DNA topoisomerase II